MAATHLAVWTAAVSACADGGDALVVSHGGAIELTRVAALPHRPTAGWGPPLGHAAGVRLEYRDGVFMALRFLSADGRVDGARAGWGVLAPGVAPAGTGDPS